MKNALRLARGNYWKIALLCLLYILTAVLSVLQAMATRNFVDYAVAGDHRGFVLWLFLFFAMIFLQIAVSTGANILYEATDIAIGNAIKRHYVNTIVSRDHLSVKKLHSGDLMQRIFVDSAAVSSNLLWIPCEVCSLSAKLVAAIVYLAVLQWKLAAVLILCFFGMSLIALPLRRLVRKYHRQVMEKEGNVKSFLQEVFDNLLVVQSFQAEENTDRQNLSRLNILRGARMRRRYLSAFMSAASSASVNFAYILGLGWCGLGIIRGTISFGMLSAVWQLVGQITSPAMRVSKVIPQYYTMTASAERLQELEQIPAEAAAPDTPWADVSRNFSAIRLENLSFSYANQEGNPVSVLKDMDLTVHSGDFIAITGESGIGKSTLLKLLLGIYTPEAGDRKILWGSGREAVLDAGARNMIAYVPQGNFLMSGTILEAIHFWSEEPCDMERLMAACEAAEVTSFLDQLPDGLDTQLGERGAGLSEGQLQRVALARAIYSGKPVLLLDEATSALDEETEARVLANLKQLNDRTAVIVTHRKAALNICNRVIALEAGKVRESHG